jgi:hypothetical protein
MKTVSHITFQETDSLHKLLLTTTVMQSISNNCMQVLNPCLVFSMPVIAWVIRTQARQIVWYTIGWTTAFVLKHLQQAYPNLSKLRRDVRDDYN